MRSTALVVDPTPPDERQMIQRGSLAIRADFQREHDMEYAARMYLSGRSISEIAEKMGVATHIVTADLQRIRDEWRENRVADFDQAKNIELAKLDALEQTYWQAWYDSSKSVVRRRRERKFGEDVRLNGVYGATREPTKTGTQQVQIERPNTGNPAFLAGVERCIDRRIKLLGLDAPTKSAVMLAQPVQGAEGSKPNEPVSDATRVAIIIADWQRSKSVPLSDATGGTGIVDGVATERPEGGV